MGDIAVTIDLRTQGVARSRTSLTGRPITVTLPSLDTTLRQLLTALVRSEVAAFAERSSDRTKPRVLDESEILDGLAVGRVSAGCRESTGPVDVDAAIDTALRAHEDGLYEIVIDGSHSIALDDRILVDDGSTVLVIRLVSLTGGR